MPGTLHRGRIRAMNTYNRFTKPGTTTCAPRRVSRYAILAASLAVSPVSVRLWPIPARARNSVCVVPGQNTVTVTPVPFNSFRTDDENDSRNALHAPYTD